ncbi:hypothetical protein MHK_002126 [Candidatus Magnetomorum sp. HK-1]|nr:hypothetical protein MHK_002126 [Candidatus Magnetomorum sp. HK-1]
MILNKQTVNSSMFDLNQNALNSFFYFSRFEIKGFTLRELQLEICLMLCSKLNLQIKNKKTNQLFNMHIIPMMNFLKSNENNYILFDKIIESFEKSMKNSANDGFKVLTNNKTDKILKINRSFYDHQVHSTNIKLGNLFVRPEGRFVFSEGNSQNEKEENITDIIGWISNKLLTEHQDFLLLLGDFGHGKTMLCQYLTAILSQNHKKDQPIPIYLPLRKFYITNSLQRAVEKAVTPFILTDELWKNQKWIVFCDGFDELNVFHQNKMDWVILKFTELLNESHAPNIQIVLSSRPILFLDPKDRRQTVALFDHILLQPFKDNHIKAWLKNWNKTLKKNITFSMLKKRNLPDVVKTPVILFLVAQMFHDELISEDKRYTRSEIYKRFFDWTVKYGGLMEKGTPLKHSIPEQYRDILQEIAWIIFTHPDSASGILHYNVILNHLEDIFDQVPSHHFDNKIFIAHAFHSDKPYHIEFIHQSLREYLVAEKIFKILRSIKDEPEIYYNISYEKIITEKPIT